MDLVSVPSSDARPPPASGAPARQSPGGAAPAASTAAPRRRSHRRSRSDGSSDISDALRSDPGIAAAAAAAAAGQDVGLAAAANIAAGTEDAAAAAVAIAAAALQPAPQLIRPRKLPKAKAPWRKVLYEQQPYEDNHVDQAFLSMLITNQNVVILEFWEVVKGTYAVTLQLNVVALFNLIFWYTLDSCEPKDSSLVSCAPPADGATECENAADCVFTAGQPGSCSHSLHGDEAALPPTEAECLALEPPGEWSAPTQGSCALTDRAGCLASLDSGGIDPSEACAMVAKCNYIQPTLIAEWVLALDLLLLVVGCVLLSVVYEGYGPFRGLGPQPNLTYMQRQRQRAAALASGAGAGGPGGTGVVGGVDEVGLMIGSALRSGLLMVGALHAFSPLLRSLTYSFSNDTVFALTILCFTLHLVLFDFTWPTTPEPSARTAAAEKKAAAAAAAEVATLGPAAAAALLARQQQQQPPPAVGALSTAQVQVPGGGSKSGLYGVLSLNMAVFGSVLLSSLLESDRAVFAHLALAIELFALFPLWCRHIGAFHAELHYQAALGSFIVCTMALMCTSNSITMAYILAVLSFTFLVPYALCSMQRFKNTINGPWDEARVRELHSEDGS